MLDELTYLYNIKNDIFIDQSTRNVLNYIVDFRTYSSPTSTIQKDYFIILQCVLEGS